MPILFSGCRTVLPYPSRSQHTRC
ncbi:MAG: hypothetical protein KC435_03820 [Thermomicrobiales bacterium]|nr:hypothetical protein [Thermomicrobiales bacterium]